MCGWRRELTCALSFSIGKIVGCVIFGCVEITRSGKLSPAPSERGSVYLKLPAEGRTLTFWCAFEDGEVKVIGDEPTNTNYNPGSSHYQDLSG
jgi:hypothetical protein